MCWRDKPLIDQRGPGSEPGLGCDHDVLALGAERLAQHLLGLTFGVDAHRTEEVDAAVEGLILHQLVRQSLSDFRDRSEDSAAASKRHRAEGQARNNQTGVAHSCILHALTSFAKTSLPSCDGNGTTSIRRFDCRWQGCIIVSSDGTDHPCEQPVATREQDWRPYSAV